MVNFKKLNTTTVEFNGTDNWINKPMSGVIVHFWDFNYYAVYFYDANGNRLDVCAYSAKTLKDCKNWLTK